jgi:hypothetical protein
MDVLASTLSKSEKTPKADNPKNNDLGNEN